MSITRSLAPGFRTGVTSVAETSMHCIIGRRGLLINDFTPNIATTKFTRVAFERNPRKEQETKREEIAMPREASQCFFFFSFFFDLHGVFFISAVDSQDHEWSVPSRVPQHFARDEILDAFSLHRMMCYQTENKMWWIIPAISLRNVSDEIA